MWKTGHSLIKKKMKQTGALLAGEMSGHIFFKERWFGFDDGIYSAARLLEILSKEKTAEELFATFPNDISTPEINIHVTEEANSASLMHCTRRRLGRSQPDHHRRCAGRLRQRLGPGSRLQHHTGAGAALRGRHEAELQRIKDVFHTQLKRVAPDLQLPF
jgi:phosphomannomutase/phosphoglucomutase